MSDNPEDFWNEIALKITLNSLEGLKNCVTFGKTDTAEYTFYKNSLHCGLTYFENKLKEKDAPNS